MGGVRGGVSDGGELASEFSDFLYLLQQQLGADANGISACGESLVFFATAVAFLYSFTVS